MSWNPNQPRKPAGSPDGGEWARVENWWRETRPHAALPSGPAQEMHALTAYRKAKRKGSQFAADRARINSDFKSAYEKMADERKSIRNEMVKANAGFMWHIAPRLDRKK